MHCFDTNRKSCNTLKVRISIICIKIPVILKRWTVTKCTIQLRNLPTWLFNVHQKKVLIETLTDCYTYPRNRQFYLLFTIKNCTKKANIFRNYMGWQISLVIKPQIWTNKIVVILITKLSHSTHSYKESN